LPQRCNEDAKGRDLVVFLRNAAKAGLLQCAYHIPTDLSCEFVFIVAGAKESLLRRGMEFSNQPLIFSPSAIKDSGVRTNHFRQNLKTKGT
jgi:hypothetical protein